MAELYYPACAVNPAEKEMKASTSSFNSSFSNVSGGIVMVEYGMSNSYMANVQLPRRAQELMPSKNGCHTSSTNSFLNVSNEEPVVDAQQSQNAYKIMKNPKMVNSFNINENYARHTSNNKFPSDDLDLNKHMTLNDLMQIWAIMEESGMFCVEGMISGVLPREIRSPLLNDNENLLTNFLLRKTAHTSEPRLVQSTVNQESDAVVLASNPEVDIKPPTRGRGRPRKVAAQATPSTSEQDYRVFGAVDFHVVPQIFSNLPARKSKLACQKKIHTSFSEDDLTSNSSDQDYVPDIEMRDHIPHKRIKKNHEDDDCSASESSVKSETDEEKKRKNNEASRKSRIKHTKQIEQKIVYRRFLEAKYNRLMAKVKQLEEAIQKMKEKIIKENGNSNTRF